MSFLSKAVKTVTKPVQKVLSSQPIKKIESTVVNTAAGFAAGGGVGAAAGFARGVVENSKTGDSESINLRNTGQAAVTGGVANVAAGLAFAAGHAVAGAGGITGTLGKAAAWAKAGGASGLLVNNFGNIVKGAQQYLSPAGAIPQTIAAPFEGSSGLSASDVAKTADKALTGYRKLRDNVPGGKDLETQVRSNVQRKTRDTLAGYVGNQNPGSPVIVNEPGGAAAMAGVNPMILIVGAGVLFYFLKKK